MARKDRKFTIKLSKEDLRLKPRSGVIPSKRHRDKSKYSRKSKHKKPVAD